MSTTLVERGIESVLLISHLNDPSDVGALKDCLQEYQKQWPRTSFRRTGRHEHATGNWAVRLSVAQRRPSLQEIRIRLDVRPAEDSVPRSSESTTIRAQELRAVVQFIAGLDVKASCHVHVDWEFEPGSHECVIKLPMLVTAGNKLPFEAISGVRFKKSIEEDVGSVIVDSDTEGGMHVTAVFSLAGLPSFDAVERAVSRGTMILEDLVVPVEAAAQQKKG